MPSSFFLLLHFFFSISQVSSSTEVVVRTSKGSVAGFHVDYGSDKSALFYGEADVFLGIPFAKPPIGPLRFKLPQQMCSYGKETYNATYYRPKCPQVYNTPQDEDCLYLNVMTPKAASSSSLPVMVYFHGGSNTVGGAPDQHYKGAVRNLVSRGVVVVTTQYRLGMLGLFTTFTREMPPNRAFFDQHLALRWVRDEIAAFGGDPNRVTIFGESAGAQVVSAHSLSPLSRGLFHQIIMESASTFSAFAIPDDPNGDINHIRAKQVCNFTSEMWTKGDFTPLYNCLKEKPSKAFTDLDFILYRLEWSLLYDGAFIPEPPSKLALRRPNYPSMIGNTLDEYPDFVLSLPESDFNEHSISTHIAYYKNYFTEEQFAQMEKLAIEAFRVEPMSNSSSHLAWLQLTSKVLSGQILNAPMAQDIAWFKNNGAQILYLYTYDYKEQQCLRTKWKEWQTAIHTTEMCYLWFNQSFVEPLSADGRFTAKDMRIAEMLGEAWTNFAKDSSKNPLMPWKRAGKSNAFFRLNPYGDDAMDTGYLAKEHEFFNIKLPSLHPNWQPETVSEKWQRKLKELGEGVLADFNKGLCMNSDSLCGMHLLTALPLAMIYFFV